MALQSEKFVRLNNRSSLILYDCGKNIARKAWNRIDMLKRNRHKEPYHLRNHTNHTITYVPYLGQQNMRWFVFQILLKDTSPPPPPADLIIWKAALFILNVGNPTFATEIKVLYKWKLVPGIGKNVATEVRYLLGSQRRYRIVPVPVRTSEKHYFSL